MQPKGRRALSLRNPSNTRTGTESPISWTEFEVSAGHSDSTPVGSGGVLTQIPFTPELGPPPAVLLAHLQQSGSQSAVLDPDQAWYGSRY